MSGWGTHLQVLTVAGVWSREVEELHIVILDMGTAQFAMNAFLPRIIGELVILRGNSATVVSYLEKLGGTASNVMCTLAQ